MTDRKERLRIARAHAGFDGPSEAARAKSLNINTLTSHENGNRDYGKKAAEQYAKAFGVSAGWLLTGDGFGPDGHGDSIDAKIQGLPAKARQQIESYVDFVIKENQSS